MKHRSYRGTVHYLTDGTGEMGREMFYVTIQPDGTRTMRATCEMDDARLLRDAVLTVDAAWRPIDAFVRLSIQEQTVGSSWFRFTPTLAECQGYTVKEGRLAQRFETAARTQGFGAHPVHGDAWRLGQLATRVPGQVEDAPGPGFSSSTLPNGGSGPCLVPASGRIRHRYVGRETIACVAGRFDTEHFQLLIGDYPPIEVWATPEDCIPVRQRWDYLEQTYELVELSGDPR